MQRVNINGFTIIEMITVLILLGVLSVTVAPRFFDDAGIEEYTVKDQLLADLRLMQTRAMNQRDLSQNCHDFLILHDRFGLAQPNQACVASPAINESDAGNDGVLLSGVGKILSDDSGVAIAVTQSTTSTQLPFLIGFDYWGRPTQQCVGGCQITVSGVNNTVVTIEAEGYIH